MSTQLQKRALDNLVGNGGNITDAMRKAGYSPNTYNTPQKLTESRGYKNLFKKYGLTEGLITKALVFDIKNKPKDRVRELTLGADILKMKEAEGVGNKVIIISVNPTIAQQNEIKK